MRRLINLAKWVWGWRQRRRDEAAKVRSSQMTFVFRTCVKDVFEAVRIGVAKELSPEDAQRLEAVYFRFLSEAEACFNDVDFQDLTKNAREKTKTRPTQ